MNENENIFNLFDTKTKEVLINCQKIAHDMKSFSETKHLLLALLITPNTQSQKILKSYTSHISNIGELIYQHKDKETKSTKDITKELETILKIAIDNSITHEENKVNTEDLLWAIVKSKNCSAYKILEKLNIDTRNIELELENKFQKNTSAISNLDLNELYLNPQTPSIENLKGEDMSINPQFFFENPLSENQLNSSKPKKTYLEEFGTNLTKLAQEKKLDKLTGRDKEIKRLIQILCRRNKNNPVLVGEPGIGKTAIVEGLAQKIATGEVPAKLLDKQIIRLDLALTVAGTMYRGQFETRIKKIISEASDNPDIILFIDEIHTMVGTGSAEGSMDTANILKPTLTQGKIRLVGTTTYEEYRKHIEKDSALERRLQKIIVKEPTKKETLSIVKNLKKTMENYHHVKITDDALQSAVDLSERYISDRFLPDKAIDLIDEASSAVYLKTSSLEEKQYLDLKNKIKKIIDKKEEAIERQDFAEAAYLRSKELKVKQEIDILAKKEKIILKKKTVSDRDIASVVSLWTQIPLDNLVKEDYSEIKSLDKKISREVIGQEEAVKLITDSIKRTKTKLSDPNRPLGTFIFLGPTGVGKTHLAKILAKIMFGTEKKLIKIDMSEFMERHNVSRLVGAPPGYVGYDDAGKLTETIRNNPYSVILLDEIEKAHPDTYNILLQILEDGQLTDSKGRLVNFRNTIIIMTSNIGISEIKKQAQLGFSQTKKFKDEYSKIKSQISKEIKKTFKPEFINRIDNIIIFKPLSKESIHKIIKLELDKLSQRLSHIKIKLTWSKTVVDYLAQKSYNPEYGAREIRRSINSLITQNISEKILNNKKINKLIIKLSKNKIKIETK